VAVAFLRLKQQQEQQQHDHSIDATSLLPPCNIASFYQ
jgi:hypothetical protein